MILAETVGAVGVVLILDVAKAADVLGADHVSWDLQAHQLT